MTEPSRPGVIAFLVDPWRTTATWRCRHAALDVPFGFAAASASA